MVLGTKLSFNPKLNVDQPPARPAWSQTRNVSASTCRIYLDIVFLVLYWNTLEAHRRPSHMLWALPWHQLAWSQSKNPRRLIGALGYLLGSYFALVNWLGYHSPWEWVFQSTNFNTSVLTSLTFDQLSRSKGDSLGLIRCGFIQES